MAGIGANQRVTFSPSKLPVHEYGAVAELELDAVRALEDEGWNWVASRNSNNQANVSNTGRDRLVESLRSVGEV